MHKKNTKNNIYDFIIEKGLSKAFSQGDAYKEDKVNTPQKLKNLEDKTNTLSFIIKIVLIVMFIAYVGFILDAIYFHVNNEQFYEKYDKKFIDLKDAFNEIKNQNNLVELKIHEIERKGIILNDIIKSEKEYLENKINQQQAVLDCLKEKEYWQYEQCFK